MAPPTERRRVTSFVPHARVRSHSIPFVFFGDPGTTRGLLNSYASTELLETGNGKGMGLTMEQSSQCLTSITRNALQARLYVEHKK